MKSPSPPDPVKTADAQAQANKEAVLESAKVNQINEITPWGSLTYTGEIGSPDRTRITEFSPETQRQFELQSQIANILGQEAVDRAGYVDSGPFTLDNLPDTSGYEQAAYERAIGLMRPDWERQDRQLQTRLSNQGIPVGSEAYADAISPIERERERVRTAAAFDAMNAGRSMRSQDINEMLLERTQPMNELAAILQGSPALGQPQFGQAAQYQVAPTDAMTPIMNNYNQQSQSHNAMMGGLFSLGGALGSAAILCSVEFKENYRPASEILPRIESLTVEAWDYKPGYGDGGTHIGPYAEEFKALFGVGDGKTINVIDAFGVCLLGIKELTERVKYLEAQNG